MGVKLYWSDSEMPSFVTLLPGVENVHLVKDVGMIPYIMQKYYSYESFLACYDTGPYDYLKDEVKGLKMIFLKPTGDVQQDGIEFLTAHAKEIDVLHLFHLVYNSIVWAFIYKTYNPKGKVYLRLDANGNIYKATWPNINKLLKYFDLISVETLAYYNFLQETWPVKVEHLPTGFYDSGIKEVVNFADKDNTILTIGRIGSMPKANHILLESFQIAAAVLPGWKVKLVGPVTAEFKDYVSQLIAATPDLKDRIILMDNISDRKQLRQEYQKAKILCHTSLWESFPHVFPEALQNGCFIISSDLPCAWDITQDKRLGDVFPVNNNLALAGTLIRYCNDEATLRRVCQEGQSYAYEKFYWVDICGKLAKLLG